MAKPLEFKREITKALRELKGSFPIISVTGPRQSGKTTLAKREFPKKKYFNLEDPSQRMAIQDDPKGMLNSLGKEGAIFDEVQHYPELLSYLQVEADEKKIKGLFVITGSYNLALMESISQSLAGRVGLLELLPMSTQELAKANINLSADELMFHGGLPRIFQDNISPTLVYKNYVKTYIERDMRQIINVNDLSQFQRFMQLCASRVGNEFNASGIGNELGVSYHTVQSWLSVLEASYIVFRLQPYFENFGKRIIKSPKLYFSDVGLATYLLGIEKVEQLARDPLKGALFENLVILDFYKHLLNQGREARIFYYRDKSQNEVDLIWQNARQLIPVEIKYGQTYKNEFMKNIKYFSEIAKGRAPYGYVVFGGETIKKDKSPWRILNYKDIQKIVSEN